MSIGENLKRIAAWHDRNVEQDYFFLAQGASESEFDALERTIGRRLPEDLRQSYLLHNGTGWIPEIGEIMPIGGVESIESTWRQYSSWQLEEGWGLGDDYKTEYIKGPIKPVWWNPLRIPVTTNGGGDPVMIDLDPAEGGIHGQVIRWGHEEGPREVLAPSWAEWLAAIADDLEAGKYAFNGDEVLRVPQK